MNNKYYARKIGQFGVHQIVEYNVNDILHKIDTGNKFLAQMLELNKTNSELYNVDVDNADKSLTFYAITRVVRGTTSEIDLNKIMHTYIVYFTKVGTAELKANSSNLAIDYSNVVLENLIKSNNNVLNSINNKVNTTSLFVSRIMVDNRVPTNDIVCIYRSKIINAIKCNSCGKIISKTSIARHKKSMKCAIDTATKDVIEDNWVRVDEPAKISHIINANIEHKIKPFRLKVWVPKHVWCAINTYYNNNNGYAGMKLGEYLKKTVGDN